MNIYTEAGWLDVPLLIRQGMPFIFVTGARGTGKTYGAFSYVIEERIPFIFMRRTLSEIEVLWSNEMLNPFMDYNRDHGTNIGIIKKTKYTGIICEREEDKNGKLIQSGPALGLAAALSTFANLRGFSGSQYEFLFYDEFIPEKHVRSLKDEHMAFMNVYETVNRNRELTGRKPLQCFCASNSNRLDNDIYMGLQLVSKVDAMKRKGQLVSVMAKRGILLVNMEKSPISQRKETTALYRMAAGTGFDAMALRNEYIGEEETGKIKSRPLGEYNPICAVGEICIYRHKSKREYYITTHFSGSPPTFGVGDAERLRFRKAFGWIWREYIEDLCIFESRICEILLTKYID